MANSNKRQKTVVIGAGPVGTLAAIYAAQRDHDVEIYELRSDLRDPTTTPLNFTRSINLALSERGVTAMKASNVAGLTEKVMEETIPMRARMIHSRDITGELYEQSQQYSIDNQGILAVDRGQLNKILLDRAESMPNVKIFFNYKLTGADFKRNKAWFEIMRNSKTSTGRNHEIEIDFDFLIGADGAHSAARYHMMKFARLDYQQEYIDTLWCEFHISAKDILPSEDPTSRFRISPNHLHIWPGKEHMFIAIPSFDGSFTCTLFLPSSHFASLSASPSTLPTFFDTHFPGVTSLIPPTSLIASFTQNPHLPLISIKCAPYHYSSSAVILGDAAHAMVPFYGQGMNAGLEDVRILFSFLDSHPSTTSTPNDPITRAQALEAYSTFRKQDAYAINDLALRNYTEMRASVTSPFYKVRKYAEENLSVWFPRLGWKTQYSRVSFGNERYSEVIRKSERQGRLLVFWALGLGLPVFGGILSTVFYGGVRWWVGFGRGGR